LGDLSKNFSEREFKCECCGFFVKNDDLLKKLQKLRDKIALKIRVNSGCRCVLHNISVGGSETSSHMRGLAADISCSDNKLLAAWALIMFPRVGIGRNFEFVHVDVDEAKGKGAWTY
jgi:uncharacterized protein YcbK (DUF882 family)